MSDNFVKEAVDAFKIDENHWKEVYEKANSDLHFLSDAPDAQWNEQAYNDRISTGRPAITADKLGQFTRQVANQIKINTPSINVIPSDIAASKETAEVLKGLIKNIEYRSNADSVYDNSVLSSIRCSIGFIKVEHDYIDGESFDQELKIKKVVNPLSCYLDSKSIETDGSDAKHAFILEKISVKSFKKKYPKFDPVDFTDDNKDYSGGSDDGDELTIAEYFKIEEEKVDSVILEDGTIQDYSKELEGQYANRRHLTKRIVKRCMISGADILEETTVAGKYIPLVPVYGDEMWLKGERNLFSLIRKAKDPQRLHNFWKTLETELLMTQPISPFMAAEGQVENYAEDYKNTNKTSVLRYDPVDVNGNVLPPPQRVAPPPAPVGVINASQGTVDDIKSATGMYNASLGQASNETSGIAIQRRKQEGEVGTYHFADNLSKSITHVGQVLVSAIPEIYDTQRVLGIINDEEEPSLVGVNGEKVEDQKEDHDLTLGKYDVKVVTGNSFTTMRQETSEYLSQIMQSNPELTQVIGDLAFKYSDIAGAEAIANRLKKTIDPALLEENEDGEEQDPMKLQMQQIIEQAQQEMGAMQEELARVSAELESKDKDLEIKAMSEHNKAQANQDKTEIELLKFKLDAKDTNFDNEVQVRELQLKERELSLKELETRSRIENEQLKTLGDLSEIDSEYEQSLDNNVNVNEREENE